MYQQCCGACDEQRWLLGCICTPPVRHACMQDSFIEFPMLRCALVPFVWMLRCALVPFVWMLRCALVPFVWMLKCTLVPFVWMLALQMLDCCRPLENVRKAGITLTHAACLSRCNGARVDLHRYGTFTLEDLRRQVGRLPGGKC